MITAKASLKVTTTATTSNVKEGSLCTIAQATRVGIIEASELTVTNGQMKGATYNTEGKEYLVAKAAETDYNLEGLKALGYEGTTEYKKGLGDLYSDNGLTITSPTTDGVEYTTTDGAFAYGSLSIYVWIDGTDKSCTNAIYR